MAEAHQRPNADPVTRRLELIEKLEHETSTTVITYVTNTRQNLGVPMAMDAIRVIYEHLKSATAHGEKVPTVDLFIHSDGGDGTVPWRLVTLIREYAERFRVLVPHRAFSAATLTALGADEIVMHPMGMLGPIDPTVGNEFNPQNPLNPGQRIGISVEDVGAYISLIRDDVGIRHEDELVQAFNALASQVHPLALGNVKRSQLQSRMMARKLLRLHMDPKDEHDMDEIAENLSSKLYYHGHPINRTEAQSELNLKIAAPSSTIETLMWDLYLSYEEEMEMTVPFEPIRAFVKGRQQAATTATGPTAPSTPQTAPPIPMPGAFPQPGIPQQWDVVDLPAQRLVYVESRERSDVCLQEYRVSGTETVDRVINTHLLAFGPEWRRTR